MTSLEMALVAVVLAVAAGRAQGTDPGMRVIAEPRPAVSSSQLPARVETPRAETLAGAQALALAVRD